MYLSCSDAQRDRERAKQICGSMFNMAKRKEKIIHLPSFNLHILQNELIGSTIHLGQRMHTNTTKIITSFSFLTLFAFCQVRTELFPLKFYFYCR